MEDKTEEDETQRLRALIFSSENASALVTDEEFETIAYSSRLRDFYNYRWWRDADPHNYFVFYNST